MSQERSHFLMIYIEEIFDSSLCIDALREHRNTVPKIRAIKGLKDRYLTKAMRQSNHVRHFLLPNRYPITT